MNPTTLTYGDTIGCESFVNFSFMCEQDKSTIKSHNLRLFIHDMYAFC